MQPATAIALALGLSADAFAASLTSGTLIRRIKLNKALAIALAFGTFQFAMPLLGWAGGLSVRAAMAAWPGWIAFGLLVAIGAGAIRDGLRSPDAGPRFNPLELPTLLSLAIATSLDALATGLSLSAVGIPIWGAATLIGAVAFALSLAGVFLGHCLGSSLGRKAEVAGGVLLVAVGCKLLGANALS